MNNERNNILRRAKYRRLNNARRHEQHNVSDSEGDYLQLSTIYWKFFMNLSIAIPVMTGFLVGMNTFIAGI